VSLFATNSCTSLIRKRPVLKESGTDSVFRNTILPNTSDLYLRLHPSDGVLWGRFGGGRTAKVVVPPKLLVYSFRVRAFCHKREHVMSPKNDKRGFKKPCCRFKKAVLRDSWVQAKKQSVGRAMGSRVADSEGSFRVIPRCAITPLEEPQQARAECGKRDGVPGASLRTRLSHTPLSLVRIWVTRGSFLALDNGHSCTHDICFPAGDR